MYLLELTIHDPGGPGHGERKTFNMAGIDIIGPYQGMTALFSNAWEEPVVVAEPYEAILQALPVVRIFPNPDAQRPKLLTFPKENPHERT